MAIDTTVTDIVQEINDARVDMQSFADFMFEPANVMITRRLAPDTHSLQHYLDYLDAIKLVFTQESGDVTVGDRTIKTVSQSIADAVETILKSGSRVGYPTLAAATADKANITAKTIVEITNDTTANNGVYLYDGATFTKAPDTILEQAKTYADSKLEDANLPAYNASKNLLDLEDVLGNNYAFFDEEANLNLEKMNGVSVQDAISDLQESSTGNRNNNTKRFFTKALYDYINQLNASHIDYPQLPYTQFPERFTVPDSIVNDIKLPLSTTPRLVIDTPYRADDKSVHPYILEFANPIRGYKYIMALNPYTTDKEENPVIYGGNSLTDFKMLTGFTQPLDTPPDGGYLSDNGLTYDPINGDLIAYWRSTTGSGASLRSTYWCKRTKDLLNWSDKTELFKNHDRVSDDMISPSILYNPQDGLWHCWNVNGGISESAIRHRTATSIYGDWSEPKIINPQGTTPWHLEVKFVGDKFVMIIFSRPKRNHYLGVSNDGLAWKFSATALFANSVEGTYKSTFLPKFNAQNQLYLDVLYTADNSNLWLYNTQSNAINVEV